LVISLISYLSVTIKGNRLSDNDTGIYFNMKMVYD